MNSTRARITSIIESGPNVATWGDTGARYLEATVVLSWDRDGSASVPVPTEMARRLTIGAEVDLVIDFFPVGAAQ